MSIGRTAGHSPHKADFQKINPTDEEKDEAKVSLTSALLGTFSTNDLRTIEEEN